MAARLLSQGATAEVYQWNTHLAIKLFYPDFPRDAIAYEMQIVKLVRQAGVNTPAIRALVEFQGRPGLVYDYIDGPTMLQAVLQRPWLALQAAWCFAQAHAAIHQHQQVRLPSQRERLRQMIAGAQLLTPAQRDTVIAALKHLPDSATICHGDFHPGNILLSVRGPSVIDWIGATHGHRLADVARATLVLRYATVPAYYGWRAQQRFNLVRQTMNMVYLWRYRSLAGFTTSSLRGWMLPIAAARLSERLPEDEIRRLIKLVDRLVRGT